MKKILTLASFLCVLMLIVMSCIAQKPIDTKPLQRQWMLVDFEGYSKEELIRKKAELNLSKQESNTNPLLNISVFMGCNRISGELKIQANNHLKFNNIIMTEMACENMKLEDSFINKITLVTSYQLEGHFLRLYDKNNVELMKFVAADWD